MRSKPFGAMIRSIPDRIVHVTPIFLESPGPLPFLGPNQDADGNRTGVLEVSNSPLCSYMAIKIQFPSLAKTMLLVMQERAFLHCGTIIMHL